MKFPTWIQILQYSVLQSLSLEAVSDCSARFAVVLYTEYRTRGPAEFKDKQEAVYEQVRPLVYGEQICLRQPFSVSFLLLSFSKIFTFQNYR